MVDTFLANILAERSDTAVHGHLIVLVIIKELEFIVGDWISLLYELFGRQGLVQWDLLQDLMPCGRLRVHALVQVVVFEVQVSQTCLYRLVYALGCVLAVNQHPVKLEVEAVIETASHVPTPMKEEAIEGLGDEKVSNECISLIIWQCVKYLVY